MTDGIERKLAAILAADVVGYSRLMGLDEVGTRQSVRKVQSTRLEPLIHKHNGQIFKVMGDGFLAEFASVVSAVEAALSIQREQAQDPAFALTDEPVQLRIGVHLGDVLVEDGDRFGDGVNIAARIEGLAQPGGIALSEDAYRQIRDRLPVPWDNGGLRTVKNITRPIQVWHWGGAHRPATVAATTTVTDAATEVLPLPDRPSVAVLPFETMSNDPEQEYFADGMTEDLITDLSKISGLFVVARNSTVMFKGKSADVREMGQRLGVRHLVEGRVRKAANRVRINVQLLDAQSGGHVWAERYDGNLEAVFELQDNVCAEVVSALSVRLTQSEKSRMNDVHTHNVEAYQLYVRAKATPYPPIPERLQTARDMFAQVATMAPDFAGGHAGLAWTTAFSGLFGHGERLGLGQKAEEFARTAIAADPNFGFTYVGLGVAYLVQGRLADAISAAERALDMVPNDADAHAFQAMFLSLDRQFDRAMTHVETALRLNPTFVSGPYRNLRTQILFLRGDYAGAVVSHNDNVARGGPVGPPAYAWVAASHKALEEDQAATQIVTEFLDRFPAFRLEGWNFLDLFPTAIERKRVHDLMARAGIPE